MSLGGGSVTDQPNDHHTRLDQEVASLTDALLSGETLAPSPEAAPLADVAQQLQALMASDQPPSSAFQARLERTLAAEWAARGPAQPQGRQRAPAWRIFAPLVAAAAAVALLVLLIPADATLTLNLSGTATGNPAAGVMVSWRAVLTVLGLGGATLYTLYRLRR